MGQEVKNPLRAQSKYGLMESSAKTGKKNFQGSPEHFLHKNAIWYRTPPPTHQLQSTCVQDGSRVPNLQTEFNYLDSFKSYGIFSDFVVLMVPTSSPSSLCRPCHPHIVPIAPRRSPCGPHGLWSPWSPWSPHVVPVVSVVSTCCPCGPHIVPVIPTSSPSSPHHLEGPHIIPNPPDTHSTHLHPPGSGGPRISKNTIRFELIEIF